MFWGSFINRKYTLLCNHKQMLPRWLPVHRTRRIQASQSSIGRSRRDTSIRHKLVNFENEFHHFCKNYLFHIIVLTMNILFANLP
jgi:hypothetical protein